jgi:hypothetical protein
MSASLAAAYLNISGTKFLADVEAGKYPKLPDTMSAMSGPTLTSMP